MRLFDEPYYLAINEARWEAAARLLGDPAALGLRTCLDVGAGPGWFAAKLVELGLDVTGVEGRADLAEQARTRVPGARFVRADVDNERIFPEGYTADLVFCFGLLYHVENPFALLRTLSRLTGKLLLLETQVIPRSEPILWLVEEGRNETQGLTHHALIPSRAALAKLMAAAGFTHVYEYGGGVPHEDFTGSTERQPRRGLFAAAREPLTLPDLMLLPPPTTPKYDYSLA